MVFQPKKLDEMGLDKLSKIFLAGLDENSRLNEKREFVNSILPVYKYKLLQMLLSNKQLSEKHRLNCLSIFLDKRTMYFDFVQHTCNQLTVTSIFEIIPSYCPNIETINFINVRITIYNKENFKILLKQCTSLQSRWVMCLGVGDCAISRLLVIEDFELHDRDVQIGLLKIQHIEGYFLDKKSCAKLLNLLPNLKTLGIFQIIGPAVSCYINSNYDKRVLKITQFYDMGTSLDSLQNLVKYCPETERIALDKPQKNVIQNLWKFPLLKVLKIYHPYLDVDEVTNLLKEIGNQLQILILFTLGDSISQFDPIILQNLCPKLEYLKINSTIYISHSNK